MSDNFFSPPLEGVKPLSYSSVAQLSVSSSPTPPPSSQALQSPPISSTTSSNNFSSLEISSLKNSGCISKIYPIVTTTAEGQVIQKSQNHDTNHISTQFCDILSSQQQQNIINGKSSIVGHQEPSISYQQQQLIGSYGNCLNNRNRYMPYTYRPYSNLGLSFNNANNNNCHHQQQPNQQKQQSHQQQQQFASVLANCSSVTSTSNKTFFEQDIATIKTNNNNNNNNINISNNSINNEVYQNPDSGSVIPASSPCLNGDNNQAISLQISNLDYTLNENSLRNFLLGQLKPITPVLSLIFETNSCARVTVPDLHFAKQVVANLHRKKIGHKRMVVSYTRDSSLTEINTLRCQVAGLLKDVPYCTLPMYKFRELFQSRFKTSISVLDLYKMHDICNISTDTNDEKFITLHPDLLNSIENSPLLECLQHSVPYCTIHFIREQHKGWAEQDIEPLPNVFMTINDIQKIVYPLLKRHPGDIPVSSLIHCIKGELGIQIIPNDNGVNLEHLICCVHGIQITTNNFGIKILGWLEPENTVGKDINDSRSFLKSGSLSDPLYQLSREVMELVKMCPKSTMKFNRFIPAYHNHFGKQCRVADYGYTKLIELFEALSSVIQIMGDGENRQITLTHRIQVKRFTSDLLRVLRSQGSKSILLSQLPNIFSMWQNRLFDVTEYGVCDISDILDGLVNSNIIVLTTIQNGNDIIISIPIRKQTPIEIEKTCVFAGECVDLLRNAPQYSVQFQKFVRSYHYHFGYQCRLSDYGFMKLADLMDAIQGVVEIEFNSDEDKRIHLSPSVARRIFAEQLEDLIREYSGSEKTCIKFDKVLELHKKKFGYKIQPNTLGVDNLLDGLRMLPFVEILENDETLWIICHLNDQMFRSRCYGACRVIQESGKELLEMNDFKNAFNIKYNEKLSDHLIIAMHHAIEIIYDNDVQYVKITKLMKFLIRIAGLLEKRFMNLADIKSILQIGVGDCFEFGYANLFSLLKAYPDIFIIELGSTQEKIEVGLASKIISFGTSSNSSRHRRNSGIIKYGKRPAAAITPQEYSNNNNNNNNNNNLFNNNNYQANLRQPLSSYNRPSKILHYDEQKCDLNQSQEFIKKCNNLQNPLFMQNHSTALAFNKSMITTTSSSSSMNNQQHQQQQQQQQIVHMINNNNNNNTAINASNGGNKENFFNDISYNGSLNSSSGSDPNSSYGSINNGFTGDSSKLWYRRTNNNNGGNGSNILSADYCNSNENRNFFDILNIATPCNYYKAPKPDTPPTEQEIPFWINPIWAANSNDEESSKNNDSLKIELPDMKPYTILPMLMSPYTLSKTANMKQMFSFNDFDKDI